MTAARIGVLVGLTMTGLLRPVSAQQAPLAPGQWVRVVSPAGGAVRQGRLVAVLADTVVLERGPIQEWITLSSRDRLEVLRRVRSLALPGALVGAGVGVAVGSTSSRHLCEAPITNFSPTTRYCGLSPAVAAILYGLGGVAAGALIGGWFKSTSWEPLSLPGSGPVRISVAPLPRSRLALGASVAF
jgi:hypothetical protein